MKGKPLQPKYRHLEWTCKECKTIIQDFIRKNTLDYYQVKWVFHQKHQHLSNNRVGWKFRCPTSMVLWSNPQVLAKSASKHKAAWWYIYPSEKYESQLGWWTSQYMEKNTVPNHQSDINELIISSMNYTCFELAYQAKKNMVWVTSEWPKMNVNSIAQEQILQNPQFQT